MEFEASAVLLCFNGNRFHQNICCELCERITELVNTQCAVKVQFPVENVHSPDANDSTFIQLFILF